MLFMVRHRHTAEMCPGGKVRPDKEFATRLEKQMKEAGVKFEGYIDGPGHEFYFVIDTDDVAKLYAAVKELLVIGDNKIVPVTRFSDAIALAKKLGLQK